MSIQEFSLVFSLCCIISLSACVSQQPVNTNTSAATSLQITPDLRPDLPAMQSPEDTFSQSPLNQTYWIIVDQIKDYQIKSGLDSEKIAFNITGTTNLPVDSLLAIEPYKENPGSVKENPLYEFGTISVFNNGSAVNTFFSRVNVTLTPGIYRIVVHRFGLSNSTRFIVSGKDPLPMMWIGIDPVAEYHRGKNFTITGTTNLPAGSEITVTCGFNPRFPCPMWAKDVPYNWSGTVCGNDGCEGGRFSRIIPVNRGSGESNTWYVSGDTTGWCANESYRIDVAKKGWDNVSTDSIEFRFQK